MIDSKYTKQALSVDEQLEVLRGRGLIIDNYDRAKETLDSTSYFRLAGYWRMQEKDRQTHQFRKGSRFSTIIDYYNFDRELRVLLFSAIERIEITVRTKIIKHLGDGDPFWFMDRNFATKADYFQENLAKIEKEVTRSRERFIVEHFQKYAQPVLPPVWKTLEVISLGTMSKLFKNYKFARAKQKVALEFGLKHFDILTNWLGCITILRNCCAHHNRVFNRVFPLPFQLLENPQHTWITNFSFSLRSLYPIICAMTYMLEATNSNTEFGSKFLTLLHKYPQIDIKLLGFPDEWKKENFWRNIFRFQK